MKKRVLYLGSKSKSRQKLLKEAEVDFVVVEQNADESKCDWNLPLSGLVKSIAEYKMEHIVMSKGREGELAFVLTADTLSKDIDGSIEGKPLNERDAIQKLRSCRKGSIVGTAFCLDKKIYKNGIWQNQKRILKYVEAKCIFNVPDKFISVYLKKTLAGGAAGAMSIEGFGNQFLKSVEGSYSTIIGLPMYELRLALIDVSFF